MTKQKSALQRLSYKIAERVAELIDDSYRMEKEFSTEDIYRTVYYALPHDMEADVLQDEEFQRSLSDVAQQQDRGPTLLQRLREAVHADKGTPLNVVIDAAIKAVNDRDEHVAMRFIAFDQLSGFFGSTIPQVEQWMDAAIAQIKDDEYPSFSEWYNSR